MASKPLRFHPQAQQEYLAALGWYGERSLDEALNFERDLRKYTLRQFPFSIVYQDFSSEILILALAHGWRQPGYWKDRV